MAKREKKIESMLAKLRQMNKNGQKALQKADQLLEKELKAYKENKSNA